MTANFDFDKVYPKMPEDIDARNRATSAQEVADFLASSPAAYFAYCAVVRSYADPIRRLHHGDSITTWMGDELGKVTTAFDPFRDNFGAIRQRFRMRGINGVFYTGEYYPLTGDYVRLKRTKDQTS